MSDIIPKYVDGEPWCEFGCPSMEETKKYRMCLITETMDIDDETPCIPGLRQQRDKYKAERDALIKFRGNILDHFDLLPNDVKELVMDCELGELLEDALQKIFKEQPCPYCTDGVTDANEPCENCKEQGE